MRVYLDNCCYNRPFDLPDEVQIKLETDAKIYIQELIQTKHLELAWSFILDYENEQNPHNDRRTFTNRFKPMASIIVPPTPETLETALKLGRYNIKSKDAMHLACAEFARYDYFITTDYFVLKKRSLIKQIVILNPLEFIPIFREAKS